MPARVSSSRSAVSSAGSGRPYARLVGGTPYRSSAPAALDDAEHILLGELARVLS